MLSDDTSPDVEVRQVGVAADEPADACLSETSRAVVELSLAGIRRRYPQASEREVFLRLAAIRLGVETARRVYPDAAMLPDLRGQA